ncbi:unnamed protein product [Amoebophrya sp. A25]|nr:unnamed protein product [Amoebophrya sp. A25]|eukprot:GSA25T00017177001.1
MTMDRPLVSSAFLGSMLEGGLTLSRVKAARSRVRSLCCERRSESRFEERNLLHKCINNKDANKKNYCRSNYNNRNPDKKITNCKKITNYKKISWWGCSYSIYLLAISLFDIGGAGALNREKHKKENTRISAQDENLPQGGDTVVLGETTSTSAWKYKVSTVTTCEGVVGFLRGAGATDVPDTDKVCEAGTQFVPDALLLFMDGCIVNKNAKDPSVKERERLLLEKTADNRPPKVLIFGSYTDRIIPSTANPKAKSGGSNWVLRLSAGDDKEKRDEEKKAMLKPEAYVPGGGQVFPPLAESCCQPASEPVAKAQPAPQAPAPKMQQAAAAHESNKEEKDKKKEEGKLQTKKTAADMPKEEGSKDDDRPKKPVAKAEPKPAGKKQNKGRPKDDGPARKEKKEEQAAGENDATPEPPKAGPISYRGLRGARGKRAPERRRTDVSIVPSDSDETGYYGCCKVE